MAVRAGCQVHLPEGDLRAAYREFQAFAGPSQFVLDLLELGNVLEDRYAICAFSRTVFLDR